MTDLRTPDLRTQLQGLWLPLVSPFRDGELDEPSLRRLVRHYASGPVDGVILAATSGEGLTLRADELERLAATVRAELAEGGRNLPICLGLSGASTAGMCDTLDQTASWPIDGYLISSPYYLRPSQRGLLAHFSALADRAAFPIVLYNIPYRSAVNLANETLLALAEHPNIVGLKDCCADRAQSIDLLNRRPAGFRVLTGEDAQYFEALDDGADGAILLSAHIETETFASVHTLLKARQARCRLGALARGHRADPAVVHRTEPGAGKVLAGAKRADRARRSPLSDGRGEHGIGRAPRSGNRAADGGIARSCLWLMRGDRVASNSLQRDGGNLKSCGLFDPHRQKTRGETMTNNSARAERLQDLLMLSSFGFWAVLLGFAPVVAYHSLMS